MPFKPVQPGQPITDKLWNGLPAAIVAHLLEYALTSDGSILFNRISKGRLSLSAPGSAGGSGYIPPFVCIPQGGGAGSAKLRVRKGTINDRDESSGLTVLGTTGTPPAGWWEFSMTANATRYGVARVTIDAGGTITAAQFSLTASPTLTGAGDPGTGAPPPMAYRKMFKVVTDSNADATVTPYFRGSQNVTVYMTDFTCATKTRVVVWDPSGE